MANELDTQIDVSELDAEQVELYGSALKTFATENDVILPGEDLTVVEVQNFINDTLADRELDELSPEEYAEYCKGITEQAKAMGIDFSESDSMHEVKRMIAAKVAEIEEGDEDTSKEVPAAFAKQAAQDKAAKDKKVKVKHECMALIRCEITSMDPAKKAYDADFIQAGNSVAGTIKRVFPLGKETHVEQIILNALRQKKFSQDYEKKHPNGAVTSEFRQVSAYAINVLPQLTPAELKALEHQQAMEQNLPTS